jgi:glucose dehydrogenase
LANVRCGGFGNTADGFRHSPLKQITSGNVSELGRVYIVDFHALDARGAASSRTRSSRTGRCT